MKVANNIQKRLPLILETKQQVIRQLIAKYMVVQTICQGKVSSAKIPCQCYVISIRGGGSVGPRGHGLHTNLNLGPS